MGRAPSVLTAWPPLPSPSLPPFQPTLPSPPAAAISLSWKTIVDADSVIDEYVPVVPWGRLPRAPFTATGKSNQLALMRQQRATASSHYSMGKRIIERQK